MRLLRVRGKSNQRQKPQNKIIRLFKIIQSELKTHLIKPAFGASFQSFHSSLRQSRKGRRLLPFVQSLGFYFVFPSTGSIV